MVSHSHLRAEVHFTANAISATGTATTKDRILIHVFLPLGHGM